MSLSIPSVARDLGDEVSSQKVFHSMTPFSSLHKQCMETILIPMTGAVLSKVKSKLWLKVALQSPSAPLSAVFEIMVLRASAFSSTKALCNQDLTQTPRAGTSPLNFTGSFRDWTCIPRLHQIAVPTLIYNGQFDTSHDVTTAPFFEHIPRVRWITFPNAGHMCHLEGLELREKVLRVVGEFLIQGQMPQTSDVPPH